MLPEQGGSVPVAKWGVAKSWPGIGDSAAAEAPQLLLVSKAGGMPSDRECLPGGEISEVLPKEL